MAQFTVRVELHEAKWEDYENSMLRWKERVFLV